MNILLLPWEDLLEMSTDRFYEMRSIIQHHNPQIGFLMLKSDNEKDMTQLYQQLFEDTEVDHDRNTIYFGIGSRAQFTEGVFALNDMHSDEKHAENIAKMIAAYTKEKPVVVFIAKRELLQFTIERLLLTEKFEYSYLTELEQQLVLVHK